MITNRLNFIFSLVGNLEYDNLGKKKILLANVFLLSRLSFIPKK